MLPYNQARVEDEGAPNLKTNVAFVAIIVGALIAFEIFNFSTTDHALRDLLGELSFAGVRWATILALAFCGIDFAGIARLFTPEQGMDEPKEVWYLFGAWLLAATMNAILTWWGVSMAVVTHTVQSTAVIDPATLTSVVPVFVAVMVWVVRILIIGTLSMAVDRLVHPHQRQQTTTFQRAVQVTSERARAIAEAKQETRLPTGAGSYSGPVQRPLPVPKAVAARRGSTTNTALDPAPTQGRRVQRDTELQERAPVERGAPAELKYHSLSLSPRPSVERSPREGGSGSGRSIRS